MAGWIKLYDKILNWEWYTDTNVKVVFLHCLLKANYQKKDWRNETIERGQLVTSISNLAKELDLTPKQIRGALNKLKRTNEVAIKGTSLYSVITINNYESYQAAGQGQGQTEGQAIGLSKGKQKGNNFRDIDITDNKEEQIKKTTTKRSSTKESTFNIQEYLRNKGVCEEYIRDWLLVRKNKKATNTETAMNKIEKQIKLAGITWNDAIGFCIEWDWKGFKCDWYKKRISSEQQSQFVEQTNLFDGMSAEERAFREKEERDRQALLKIYREKNKQRNE